MSRVQVMRFQAQKFCDTHEEAVEHASKMEKIFKFDFTPFFENELVDVHFEDGCVATVDTGDGDKEVSLAEVYVSITQLKQNLSANSDRMYKISAMLDGFLKASGWSFMNSFDLEDFETANEIEDVESHIAFVQARIDRCPISSEKIHCRLLGAHHTQLGDGRVVRKVDVDELKQLQKELTRAKRFWAKEIQNA